MEVLFQFEAWIETGVGSNHFYLRAVGKLQCSSFMLSGSSSIILASFIIRVFELSLLFLPLSIISIKPHIVTFAPDS